MSKPLLAVLKGEKPSHIPVWLMRQAGRYLPEYREIRKQAKTFLDLCYSPALASEVTLQPIRRFGFDAAIIFADILLVPHALGQNVSFETGEGPRLDPVRDLDGVRKLTMDRLLDRLSPVFETVRRTHRALPANTALIGFAGAPWTVATYMVEGGGSSDQKNAKLWAQREPDQFQQLIDLLTDATARYLCAQLEAGAEVIQIFESWASSLDDLEFERWSIAPTAKLVNLVRARYPEALIIGFPRGCGTKIEAYAKGIDLNALSVDWATPLRWVSDRIGDCIALQGNLDPIRLIAGGAALSQSVARILDEMTGRRFIFNLGHGILPETPLSHVEQMMSQIRSFQP